MKNNDFLQNSLTPRQQLWGLRYLLFQTVFLSSVLYTAAALLPVQPGQAFLNFAYFSINFMAVMIIFHRFLQQQLQRFLPSIGKILLWSAVFFCTHWLSSTALGMLFSRLDPEFFNANDLTIAGMARENYFLMAFGTVFLVPVTEECLHRALVFRGLYQRSALAAWAVSAAVFSLVHVVGYIGQAQPLTLLLCFLQYIPAGLCLAGAYRLSGSLLSPILIHAAINAMGMFALR